MGYWGLFVCFCFLSKAPHPVLFSVLFISSLGVSFALPTVGLRLLILTFPLLSVRFVSDTKCLLLWFLEGTMENATLAASELVHIY